MAYTSVIRVPENIATRWLRILEARPVNTCKHPGPTPNPQNGFHTCLESPADGNSRNDNLVDVYMTSHQVHNDQG